MSGGAFDYADRNIVCVAEEIEIRVNRDFRRTNERNWFTGAIEDVDEIDCDTPEQRALIVAYAKDLVSDLRSVAERCKNLDYLLSGDYSVDTFLKNLKKP